MNSARLRAVVLCAGLGLRLRPLTASIPKPLLPVRGRLVLDRTLECLAEAGCEAVAINLHHLGHAVRDHVGERYRSVPIHYSDEPEILGTLGALVALRDFLAPADAVVLVNGDSVCRWPLRRLVGAHLDSGAGATLLLNSAADVASFGGVGVGESGSITSFPGGPDSEMTVSRLVFAGAHVLRPDLLDGFELRFSGIIDELYVPAIERGEVLLGVVADLDWHDLGTPGRYLRAVRPFDGTAWTAPAARIDRDVSIGSSVVEADAIVERGSSLSGSLVMPRAKVGEHSVVSDCIVGPDVVVPAGSRLNGEMIARDADGATLSTPIETLV